LRSSAMQGRNYVSRSQTVCSVLDTGTSAVTRY
jgi:hypothetical protein